MRRPPEQTLPTEMNKIDVLKSTKLFSRFSDEELALLSEYSELCDFEAGEQVFAQGSKARELFVIKSGQIEIFQKQKHSEKLLARYVAGDSFGDLDLLSDQPRQASANSLGKSELLIFPARGARFEELLSKHETIFAAILTKFMRIIANRMRSVNELVSQNSSWVHDLRKQLWQDKLTGLYNRSYLHDEFERFKPKKISQAAILLVKPDNFKLINDIYGHEAGDHALQIMAHTLRKEAGEKAIAIRYRGNEMVVLLPDAGKADALILSEQLHAAMNSIDYGKALGGRQIHVTFSIGIACYPQNGIGGEDIAEVAHKRLFAAREDGGNRINAG